MKQKIDTITNKIWLSKSKEELRINTSYFLLDSFNEKKGIKVQRRSWWIKNNPNNLPNQIAPSVVCGKGFENIIHNGVSIELNNKNMSTILQKTDDNVLIVGGHYLPNPKNWSSIGKETSSLFKLSLDSIEKLVKMGKDLILIIFINDIQLDQKKRAQLYHNYILPEEFRKQIILREIIRKNVPVIVISQKKLCGALVREKAKFIKKQKIHKENNKNTYLVNFGKNESFKIISSEESKETGHMRCVQACTKILNIAQKLGKKSCIQFYPVCGKEAVEKSSQIAKLLYNNNLNLINIYYSRFCFK
jgi:hypothetical protein